MFCWRAQAYGPDDPRTAQARRMHDDQVGTHFPSLAAQATHLISAASPHSRASLDDCKRRPGRGHPPCPRRSDRCLRPAAELCLRATMAAALRRRRPPATGHYRRRRRLPLAVGCTARNPACGACPRGLPAAAKRRRLRRRGQLQRPLRRQRLPSSGGRRRQRRRGGGGIRDGVEGRCPG